MLQSRKRDSELRCNDLLDITEQLRITSELLIIINLTPKPTRHTGPQTPCLGGDRALFHLLVAKGLGP